jgi:seryl-tRNA synthetase
MLDASFVRENREIVEKKLRSRGLNADLTEFFAVDEQRRSTLREAEELKHRSNVVSREIGEAQRRGENVDARKEEMGRAGFSPRFRNFTKSEY